MNWYQNNVRSYSRLGETIGKWLIQAVNGLDASHLVSVRSDIMSMMGSTDDITFAATEGTQFAEAQQRHPLTWQQQELLQQLSTLNGPNAQQGQMAQTQEPGLENTGVENAAS